MNRKTILSLGSALVALGVMSVAGYGCGDDDTATPTKDSGTVVTPEGGTMETGTPETSTPIPPPPALGAQIDRLGRPAINTALTGTFDPNPTTKGAKKDAYNQDNAQAGWNPKYIPEQAANLAVFDGLDTKCGNQFLAQDAGVNGGPNTAVYGALAGITADDRIWLNTAATTCNTYLAVEANFAATHGLISPLLANMDCGGRTLGYDVIDITYSIVATGGIGTPGAATTVSDGVNADPVKTAATAFPYLAAPLQ
ncbi:MAG: hypothetical protein JWO86_2532 [Myxococcaceae bacterium]|nr:hypothetical protein [Myxococcaceae bacterium]